MRIIGENVPQILTQKISWVGWRRIDDTKVPFNLAIGGNASSTDPRTWCSFDVAMKELAEKPGVAGLGIVLVDDLVGIDLDDCMTNGKAVDWAETIVDHLRSYTEVSPSGRGLRIFCRGALPPGRRKTSRGPKVEMYDRTSPRFLTVTGRIYRSGDVEDRTTEVAELHKVIFGVDKRAAAKASNVADLGTVKEIVTTTERVTMARRWIGRRGGATSGRGASEYCYAIAIGLVWGFGLDHEDAVDILLEWGQRLDQKNEWGQWYPWTSAQCRHKIRSAERATYSGKPGDLLIWEDARADRSREEAALTIIGGSNE